MHIPEKFRRIGRRVQNTVRRVTRTGIYWRWDDTRAHYKPIDFDELVCPLRLDILIRRDFLHFYHQHEELFVDQRQRFFELAREHDYFKWYFHVKLPRVNAEIQDDPQKAVTAFNGRVERFLDLYQSIRKNGFRAEEPITIKTSEQVLASESGKLVSNRHFPGNGCHRIAILMHLGSQSLAPEFFRLQQFNRLIPHDNTARLYKHLRIDKSEYATFLGRRYGASKRFSSLNELRKFTESSYPGKVAELESVIAGDRAGVRDVPTRPW